MANEKKDINDTVNSDMLRDKEIEKRKNADAVPVCSNCTQKEHEKDNHNNNSAHVHSNCGCVGYAYVPSQTFGETYNPEQGLANGTVFPELNLNIDEYGKVCKGAGI